jgi:hypothetical protein
MQDFKNIVHQCVYVYFVIQLVCACNNPNNRSSKSFNDDGYTKRKQIFQNIRDIWIISRGPKNMRTADSLMKKLITIKKKLLPKYDSLAILINGEINMSYNKDYTRKKELTNYKDTFYVLPAHLELYQNKHIYRTYNAYFTFDSKFNQKDILFIPHNIFNNELCRYVDTVGSEFFEIKNKKFHITAFYTDTLYPKPKEDMSPPIFRFCNWGDTILIKEWLINNDAKFINIMEKSDNQ